MQHGSLHNYLTIICYKYDISYIGYNGGSCNVIFLNTSKNTPKQISIQLPKQMSTTTKITNVKVSNIRPTYNNLEEWINDPNNVYIGRKGIVFINGIRFPKNDSIWCNPYKIDNNTIRIQKYKTYIKDKIKKENLTDELLKLKNKNLGCWCKPEACHGDVLIEIINELK